MMVALQKQPQLWVISLQRALMVLTPPWHCFLQRMLLALRHASLPDLHKCLNTSILPVVIHPAGCNGALTTGTTSALLRGCCYVLVSRRYGKFGYGFGRGSFNISREQYAAAVAAVWGAALSSIAADFDRLPPVEPMTLIIQQYNSPGGSCCCCCC